MNWQGESNLQKQVLVVEINQQFGTKWYVSKVGLPRKNN
jgi:hypothetical protein